MIVPLARKSVIAGSSNEAAIGPTRARWRFFFARESRSTRRDVIDRRGGSFDNEATAAGTVQGR
jgi:hypothetical protein